MGVSVVSPVTETVRITCGRSPRVSLFTDAVSLEAIPDSIRSIVQEQQFEDLSCIGSAKIPEHLDGVVIWCKGESPLRGSAAEWRRPFFSQPNRTTSVVVHWPYLEHADLLGLEPRLLRAHAKGTNWNPMLRIAGARPSEKRKTAWRTCGKIWARLSIALWKELEKPGSGVDSLLELWNATAGDNLFSPLVLRNVIVALMKCDKWEKAGELLDLGMQAFPACAEFPYLHAVFFILQKNPLRAVRFLEAALLCRGNEFAGSGGENSYRATYLLGLICDTVGQQEKAVNYWLPGAIEHPAFEPAVRALTQQRLPKGKARLLHHPLAETARREPQYLEPVVNFLVRNFMASAGRLLVETMAIDPARRENLLEMIGKSEERQTSRHRTVDAKPGILLTGPIFDASGHSRINRAVGQALLASPRFETVLNHTSWPTVSRQAMKEGETLWSGVCNQIDRTDLTIRHQWPPDFTRPKSGKLVCILPWEHRGVPMQWVEKIKSNVDELWTPSQFTRNALVKAGVSANQIHVLPNGIDPEIFRPDGPATRPPSSRGFIFLFVGGTIRRKGIDVLLQAYADAFMPEEEVTLVIKDLGSRSFYSHNTKLREVKQFAARRTAPHTIVIADELDDAALAALYRAADAFVLPYRGEGFGMPLIEAMACGKPVLTTGEGPAVEFCSTKEGYLIPAQEVPVPEPAPPLGPLSADWTWYEPSIAALAQTMRHVYENRDEAAARGRNAARAIEARFTWKQILPMYLDRIEKLAFDGMAIPRHLSA